MLTGQFANKPTHGQSSRGLNSRTSKLAEKNISNHQLQYTCTINLYLNLNQTLTLSIIESVRQQFTAKHISGDYLEKILNQTFRQVESAS